MTDMVSNRLVGTMSMASGTALAEVLDILCDVHGSAMDGREHYPMYANYYAGVRHQLQTIADKLPCWVIVSPDGSEYIRRYTIGRTTDGSNIYLHEFRSSDKDHGSLGPNGPGLVHSHPWPGTSFIIAGAYDEERRVTKDGIHTIERRTYKPGYVSHLLPDTFHRVDLLNYEKRLVPTTWTLFITAPKVVEDTDEHDSWGFWDRSNGQYIPWRTFMRQSGIWPTTTPRPTNVVDGDDVIPAHTKAALSTSYQPGTLDCNATWWREKCAVMERDVKAATLTLGGAEGSAYPELPGLAKDAAKEITRLKEDVRRLEAELTKARPIGDT